MRTVLVDDEIWQLRELEETCEKIPDVQINGTFRNAKDTLEYARKEPMELAFLDVDMAGMNGIQLAEQLRKIYPKMVIIFVSAYEQYMPSAFIGKAADYYILKPYKREEIISAVQRAKLLAKRMHKKVFVHTFGRFEVYVDKVLVNFQSNKAKEVLAILVDYQGQSVTTEEIFNRMFPDREYDHVQASNVRRAYMKLLETLKHYGIEDIIIKNNYSKAIDCSKVDCDYYKLLKGDTESVRLYSGKYMSDYSWGDKNVYLKSLKKV